MEKSMIIVARETKEKIVNVINTSNLPAFILKSFIKDFYDQLDALEEEQYKRALDAYEKSKKEENKKCQK